MGSVVVYPYYSYSCYGMSYDSSYYVVYSYSFSVRTIYWCVQGPASLISYARIPIIGCMPSQSEEAIITDSGLTNQTINNTQTGNFEQLNEKLEP